MLSHPLSLNPFTYRVAQEPNRNRESEPEIGTVFFPETESGTGTAGTVFQEPKPEPSFPVNC